MALGFDAFGRPAFGQINKGQAGDDDAGYLTGVAATGFTTPWVTADTCIGPTMAALGKPA